MTDLRVFQDGPSYRAAREARERVARRTRRRHRAKFGAAGGFLALATLLAVMAATASDPPTKPATKAPIARKLVPHTKVPRTGYGINLAPKQVHASFKLPVRSGLLFDVRTGKVLWQRDPRAVLPIASLTKMMTALIIVSHAREQDPVLITREAVHFTGSGVGELPLNKHVKLLALLYGLLLPSGNDAAIALAQHVAGNQPHFIGMMNRQAQAMGLSCTHYTTVSGVIDAGNHSCATDLAIETRAIFEHPLLAKIVGSRSAVLPFPIKGGHLWLYNNNPLLRLGFPGTDGVKTGFTTLAGRCLVAAAKRGHTWLGVVLLHSADPPDQAEELLNAGFAAEGT